MVEDKISKIHVRAPGKILVTGGYLILEPGVKGMCLATNAYFHCFIKSSEISNSNDFSYIRFEVHCKQINQIYAYNFNIHLSQIQNSFLEAQNGFSNPFVYNCILTCLNIILSLKGTHIPSQNIRIKLIGDNEFYSNSGGKLKKTGIGSSAALQVSLIAGILFTFNILNSKTNQKIDVENLMDEISDESKSLLFSVCHLCNALAQSKIGSGFDISAAIFGNIFFERFPSCLLNDLFSHVSQMNEFWKNSSVNNADDLFQELGSLTVSTNQNLFKYMKYEEISLDACFEIALIDIVGGSDTRVMVSQVLNWAKLHPPQQVQESIFTNQLFQDLKQHYYQFHKLLRNADFENIKTLCQKILEVLKKLSEETHVPILPKSQYDLIHYLLQSPNVFYSSVPGAGGYDAIVVIGKKEGLHQLLQQLCNIYHQQHPQFQSIEVLPITYHPNKGVFIQKF